VEFSGSSDRDAADVEDVLQKFQENTFSFFLEYDIIIIEEKNMTKTEEILNNLGIKCSLGSWETDDTHHAICYTRKQGNTWVDILSKAGYSSKVVYDNYAYIVIFQKK
jgi:hypothetical protein